MDYEAFTNMEYELTYADTVEEGAALVERILRVEAGGRRRHIGFDTEFYGVEVGKESTVARAVCHVASLAWREGGERLHPRGFYVPRAAVVSRAVVEKCVEFRRLFSNPDLVFLAHNAPVDIHVFKNEGIEVVNYVNTLTVARWVLPSRARGGGFTLDALGQDLLGEGKADAFSDIFTERVEDFRLKTSITKKCECGVPGCRKLSKPLHTKYTETQEIREPFWVEREIPLQDVTPGHPRWGRLLTYAARDAVLAHALYQVLMQQMRRTTREVPWITERDFQKAEEL